MEDDRDPADRFHPGKGIAEYFSTYLMARIGQSAVLKLRQDLYATCSRSPRLFFERHRTELSRVAAGSSAAAIETAVTSTIRDMLRESFTLISFPRGVLLLQLATDARAR